VQGADRYGGYSLFAIEQLTDPPSCITISTIAFRAEALVFSIVKTTFFLVSPVLTGVGVVEGWEAENSESNAHVQGYARCSCTALWSRKGSDANGTMVLQAS
jgi:hypothetical protein